MLEVARPTGAGASPAGWRVPAASACRVCAFTAPRLFVDIPEVEGDEAMAPGPCPAGASEPLLVVGVGWATATEKAPAAKAATAREMMEFLGNIMGSIEFGANRWRRYVTMKIY